MDLFVARKSVRGCKLPVKITHTLQGNGTNGLKQVKRDLHNRANNQTKAEKMPRWYRYELSPSTFCDPRHIRIGQYSRSSRLTPSSTPGTESRDDRSPRDPRYPPNVDINHDVLNPIYGRAPDRQCSRRARRIHSFDEPVPPRQIPKDRCRQSVESSNISDTDYSLYADQVNRHCCHSDPYIFDTQRCSDHLPSLGSNFVQAFHNLRSATGNASRVIEHLYSSFVNRASSQPHLSKSARNIMWSQTVKQNETDALRPRLDGRYTSRDNHNLESRDFVFQDRDQEQNLMSHGRKNNMSLSSVRRGIENCFDIFEQCLVSLSAATEQASLPEIHIEYLSYEEERNLHRLKDLRRLHRRIIQDIGNMRPLLDRIAQDYNAARTVLTDLQVVLGRLDGFWKVWGKDASGEGQKGSRRRRYGSASAFDHEWDVYHRGMPSIRLR